MPWLPFISMAFFVALRKESVDRNNLADLKKRSETQSLSARRAWIEIVMLFFAVFWARVALRKESVDRNQNCCPYRSSFTRRSPQGERG